MTWYHPTLAERSMLAMDKDIAASAATIRELNARIDKLRAGLKEALDIADGSGADFTWQARDRLRELRAIFTRG